MGSSLWIACWHLYLHTPRQRYDVVPINQYYRELEGSLITGGFTGVQDAALTPRGANMSAVYFWVDGEVVVVSGFVNTLDASAIGHFDCPVVDDNYHTESLRCGMFSSDEVGICTWMHMSPEAIPDLFKTHLLLLGVSL